MNFYLSTIRVRLKKTNTFSAVQTNLQKGNGDITLKSQTCLKAPSTEMDMVVNQSSLGAEAYNDRR